MNPKLIANIFGAFISIAPKIKGWVFSDGKFQPNRAGVLLIALIILVVGSVFMDVEHIHAVTDALDEISDIIGYVE